MRLFVAIDFENKDYFSEIQKKLPEANTTYPKEFHLTLQFLGETSKKDEIVDKLKQINFDPFQLKTTNIGVFPNKNTIKVVWLGLEHNDTLERLQKDIETKMRSLEFEPDYKEFKPHITLARIKYLKDSNSYIKRLKTIKFEPKEFYVKTIKLIKSTLSSDGPVYETILEI
jgi:2'-5' RNA ligase